MTMMGVTSVAGSAKVLSKPWWHVGIGRAWLVGCGTKSDFAMAEAS